MNRSSAAKNLPEVESNLCFRAIVIDDRGNVQNVVVDIESALSCEDIECVRDLIEELKHYFNTEEVPKTVTIMLCRGAKVFVFNENKLKLVILRRDMELEDAIKQCYSIFSSRL